MIAVNLKDCGGQCTMIINVPVDESANNGAFKLYQIDPWRAPGTPVADTTFRITGANFPPGATCTVGFGTTSVPAEVIHDQLIEGLLPSLEPDPTTPLDVSVECGPSATGVLSGHFYALPSYGPGVGAEAQGGAGSTTVVQPVTPAVQAPPPLK